MTPLNKIFIATSIDGFIADKKGDIDWLNSIPEINHIDTGYHQFTAEIDALLMGRSTFEKVLSFGIEWPYKKPVFVLSNSLSQIPDALKDRVHLTKGELTDVLEQIHKKGFNQLYIDGGKVIQSFLNADLIDEMIITIIPILLGGGIPLFSELPKSLDFECKKTTLFLNKVVQNHYIRKPTP